MVQLHKTALVRGIRRAGGQLIRRAGLLPGGTPDGVGEDDHLLGTSLPHTVMVFFPDPPGSLYQIEQWYAPLRELDRRYRVVIVLRDSRTARAVRRDCDLDVIVVARYATLDDLMARSSIRAALYVSHHPENFSSLRSNSMVHISLMHGDSDKAVSVSHQVTAYDFSLVAGRAAVDWVATHCPFYDAQARTIPIGRPQLDEWYAAGGAGGRRPAEEPLTVLYAPTWEGAYSSVSYGSTDSHGLALVTAFAADGWRVIYRPHPLSGVRDPGYAAADRAIRAYLAEARSDGRGHRVDTGVPVETSFRDADLLVCDVSGMATDWLALDRPLLITQPARADVEVARTRLIDAVPSVAVADIGSLPALARRQVVDDPLADKRHELADYYLGDIRPGVATRRFVEVVGDLMDRHARESERLAEIRSGAAHRGTSGGEDRRPGDRSART